tara:strand:+ start:50 stop:283 length:234 start_codon:yes stop_codon:yes gene_type:complete
MAKKEKKATLHFDGKDYLIEDLTDEQRTLANHAADLENKMASMRFNLDQLSVGHQSFVEKLRESLNEPVEEEVKEES